MSKETLSADPVTMTGRAPVPADAVRRPYGAVTALLAGVALFCLAGCEKTGTSDPETGAPAAEVKTQRSTRIVERDVEAPQVFQLSEAALWDGRPSLGGVWVAAPDVTDPERVIMRNPANGKFVIGALFRRERDNPGPRLQISSDAADALGMLAGQPATLSVTALRREQAPEDKPAMPVLDRQETLVTAPPPGEAAVAAKAGAIDGGGVTTAPLPAAPAGLATTPAAQAPAGTAGAAAAIAAAEAKAAAPAPKPAAAPPAAASGNARPIQIGFFAEESNATRALDTLKKAGVTASKRKETAQGKTYWTVTARGDAALLKKIKTAGFADAYLLK